MSTITTPATWTVPSVLGAAVCGHASEAAHLTSTSIEAKPARIRNAFVMGATDFGQDYLPGAAAWRPPLS